jgi:hypothetical protein
MVCGINKSERIRHYGLLPWEWNQHITQLLKVSIILQDEEDIIRLGIRELILRHISELSI